MKTLEEVLQFNTDAYVKYISGCKLCRGNHLECGCRKKYKLITNAFLSCVPVNFWDVLERDVTNNVAVFDNTVVPYSRNLKKALRNGYGLLFLGDNGVGKTHFISWLLMKALTKNMTTYYTRMIELDNNIKRGFKDVDIEKRLRWMMTSDFLAIDELGKERAKSCNIYTDSQVERIIKQRIDDGMPTLLASNMDIDSLGEAYGPTVESMITGKFRVVIMEPGDFRKYKQKQMLEEMGYLDE